MSRPPLLCEEGNQPVPVSSGQEFLLECYMRKTFPLLLMLIFIVRVPAFGQVDLSGEWFPLAHEDREVDRRGGAAIGDYTGLPINDAARMRADTYDASVFALPEWPCRPHGGDFITLGSSETRIWKTTDP